MGEVIKMVTIGSVSLIPLFREKINYYLYLFLQHNKLFLYELCSNLAAQVLFLIVALYRSGLEEDQRAILLFLHPVAEKGPD